MGNKISMTTPGGSTIAYGYDILNRLMTVTHPDAGGKAVTTFGYDKVGNRQSVTRTNAAGAVFSTTGYIYDTLNRLTDIVNKDGSNSVVSSYHYGLRADGKRLSVTETGPTTSGGTTNYTYDEQGKLIQEVGPYATVAYGYDNVGNRLTRAVTNMGSNSSTTLVNGVTNTVFDNNDRIISQTGPAGVTTHTYDNDGNETTVNGQAAGYDFENHLSSLGSTTSYVYDADGNRVSIYKSGTPNSTVNYVVDTSLPYASVVEEYNGTTLAARYDYGDDLIRMDRGPVGATVSSYYIYDGLGNTVRQLVNTNGVVTDTYAYSAFGEIIAYTGTTANMFLFNAQQLDGASMNYYLRARYYDQNNGRFLSQDPLEGTKAVPSSLHRYMYADADPENRFDPSGKEGIAMTIAVIAGAIIVGASLLDLALQGGVNVASSLTAYGARGYYYPDITIPLQQTVNRIELKWYSLKTDPIMQAKMAKTLTALDWSSPMASPAINAWDIINLNSASDSNSWIDQASSPKLDGKHPDLRMVVVNGQTFHSYSANYVAGGTMFRLAGYEKGDLDTWISNYKLLYAEKDVFAAREWANAGYDGWDAGNTPNSTVSSQMPATPYPASQYLPVKWSPYTDNHSYF